MKFESSSRFREYAFSLPRRHFFLIFPHSSSSFPVNPDGSRENERLGAASFWEQEAVANYHGEDKFKHPRCITRSILKTKVVGRDGGESTVAVTAHGYADEERVEYKSVHGGDGEWHDVPVPWIEYIPVQRTSNMCLSERGTPSDIFKRRAAASRESAYRRSILSFLANT